MGKGERRPVARHKEEGVWFGFWSVVGRRTEQTGGKYERGTCSVSSRYLVEISYLTGSRCSRQVQFESSRQPGQVNAGAGKGKVRRTDRQWRRDEEGGVQDHRWCLGVRGLVGEWQERLSDWERGGGET